MSKGREHEITKQQFGVIEPITPPFLRTPYNYNMHTVSQETGLHCTDKTLTKQSFKDETNINTIVERFGISGELPTNVRMPQYGDFTEVFDFQSAMNAVRQAEESFMKMPANVRARFHNDPHEFIEFCSNDDNRKEAEKLGLVSDEALAKAADLAKAPTPPPDDKAPETPPKSAAKGGKE